MTKIIIALLTALATLAISVIKRLSPKDQMSSALVKEEIIEDKIEKQIIRKADDITDWWDKFDTEANEKLAKRYRQYIRNKREEYKKIRGRLGLL